MKEVFRDKKSLDSRCIVKYGLSDEILMENAAIAMKNLIQKVTHKGSVITIVCGSGNNGADGYTLARHLAGSYMVRVLPFKEPKSELCVKQSERAFAVGVQSAKKILPCDVVVDCIVGSGMKHQLDEDLIRLLEEMQKSARIKIACDIPSGIDAFGWVETSAFRADYTLTMGGLSLCLLSDQAKEYVGEIVIGDLGVDESKYAVNSQIKMLERSDLKLPKRNQENAHKGNFGHLCVYAGNKSGAASLAGLAALYSGVGSVSIVGSKTEYFPELMYQEALPQNLSAFAVGMGMGEKIPECLNEIDFELPLILDADILRHQQIGEILQHFKKVVLTPHAGEFLSLWEICMKKSLDKQKFLRDKIPYLLEMSACYPEAVFLLKGANVYLARNNHLFINTFGNVALAKAGSGDVLSGIIASLLAQGRNTLDAAINGSLMHTFSAEEFKDKNYALHPLGLIRSLEVMKNKII